MNKKQLLQKIDEAARKKVTKLDLSGKKIASLPAEIGRLTNLTLLDLSNNQLTSLPAEIVRLTNLTELYLSDNQLTSLPAEIVRLTNLTVLYLYDNQLTSFPAEIGRLTNLTGLYLSGNQLTSLPAEIGRLTNLTELNLYHNQLTSLPAEIGRLTNLTELYLNYNQLTSLPAEIGRLTKLENLLLDENLDLTFPPQAILKQGTKAVLSYLQEQLKGEREQWVSKMLLVGEGGVGKTSTLCSLLGIDFNQYEETTRGVDILDLDLDHPKKPDVTMRLNCWDFGGQTIYHATHQFFLTDRSLFILVWDTRHGWEAGKLYKWLDTIQARAPQSPILLVAAHIDEHDADLPLAELQRKYPRIVGHFKVSNKEQTGIEQLRAAIAATAAGLPLMGEKWPAAWLEAAEAVRQLDKKYITTPQLFAALAEHGVTGDNAAILARWMHDLGDILYFSDDEEIRDTVILEPEWVSKYIGKVLESEDVIGRLGIFTHQHMRQLWGDIAPAMQDHFLRLMEKFDLSYLIPDHTDRSLVVERLPLDAPEYQKKWDAIRNTPRCREISMKYQINTIPAGIPTWFIARVHRFTTHTHWRLGALFADGDDERHLALVYTDTHTRCIMLNVRGPAPHNFFTLLRDGLELTLARFPGLKIKRTMPCPGHDDKPCDHEFDFTHLQKAIEKEPPVLELQCPQSFESVSVPGLVFGIHWLTQDLVLAAIENLRQESAAGNELLLAEIQDLRALAEREFTRLFRAEQEKPESYCPNVFILRPIDPPKWKEFLFSGATLRDVPQPRKMKLHLCCQQPGCWHPTIDEGAFVIKDVADWMITVGPLLRRLIPLLKLTLPIVASGLDFFRQEMVDKFEEGIKFAKELVGKLPEMKDFGKAEMPEASGETRSVSYAEGAALRALRKFLDDQDPAQHWGGLKRVHTPEGHYLWLCDDHAREYKR